METETIKIKPGRPIVSNSVRQQKLAEAAKLAEEGKTKPKGRPANPESKRQQSLNQKQIIIDAGGFVKPGRPKLAKDINHEITAAVIVD